MSSDRDGLIFSTLAMVLAELAQGETSSLLESKRIFDTPIYILALTLREVCVVADDRPPTTAS